MKQSLLALAGISAALSLAGPANAWFHRGYYGVAAGGGGSWAAHGWRGGSASGGGGSWSGTGWRGGTASSGGGSWSAHGAYGGSAYGSGRYWHATSPGGATASGYYHGAYGYGGSYYGAYHPPTVVNYYGSGCGTCGGWGAGAAAATVVAGAALGVAATSNAYSAGVAAGQAQALGAIYAQLPAGCTYTAALGNTYYHCGNLWLEPAFGANGVYYRSVAAP